MTNATTLLSLIPVLWATGRGSELMQPMILPVVGGMIFDVVSLFLGPGLLHLVLGAPARAGRLIPGWHWHGSSFRGPTP
jgi:Cu/Ag efflux pump CusA